MITVFLVDDQQPTRAVLRLRLELEDDLTVIGETGNDADTVAQVIALSPDVIILDATMPLRDGCVATALVHTLAANSAVVVLGLYDDPTTRAHAIAAGARAVVSKHGRDEQVLAAIRAAANPFPPHDPPVRSNGPPLR